MCARQPSPGTLRHPPREAVCPVLWEPLTRKGKPPCRELGLLEGTTALASGGDRLSPLLALLRAQNGLALPTRCGHQWSQRLRAPGGAWQDRGWFPAEQVCKCPACAVTLCETFLGWGRVGVVLWYLEQGVQCPAPGIRLLGMPHFCPTWRADVEGSRPTCWVGLTGPKRSGSATSTSPGARRQQPGHLFFQKVPSHGQHPVGRRLFCGRAFCSQCPPAPQQA